MPDDVGEAVGFGESVGLADSVGLGDAVGFGDAVAFVGSGLGILVSPSIGSP